MFAPSAYQNQNLSVCCFVTILQPWNGLPLFENMFLVAGYLYKLLIYFQGLPRKNLILCRIHFLKDVPREGKYAINEIMYSADYWPSFCFGGCWISSMDVVRKLYNMSLQTRQVQFSRPFFQSESDTIIIK